MECVCVGVFGFCTTFLIWVIWGLVARHYYSAGVLDGPPKRLFTLVTGLNYEPLWNSLSLLAELQVAVDVDTACECESWHGRGRGCGSGATYHAKNGPIQAKAARQQKQFKCYCTFRLHVLAAAAAAAAPIQCLIFRAVVFTPPPHPSSFLLLHFLYTCYCLCVFVSLPGILRIED